MGNISPTLHNDADWRFVGREAEISHVKALTSEKKSVVIFGMKKIGKSIFIKELYRQLDKSESGIECIWKDFELDDISSSAAVYDWFIELFDYIGDITEKKRFEEKFPSKKFVCTSCENCKADCITQKASIKTAINTLMLHVKKCGRNITLFVDNTDKLMEGPLKDSFLHYFRQSNSCPGFKTVVASSNRPKLLAKSYASFELKPLCDMEITELLFTTTEMRDDSNSDNSDNSDDAGNTHHSVTYSPEFKIFKPENKLLIEAIVGLCEGLPLAAIMAGKQDNHFLL